MKPLKDAKIILKNKDYKDLLNELLPYYPKLCAGFVLQDADFGKPEIKVEPVKPLDFDESRTIQFKHKNKTFQIKGAARVTKVSIEKIDAFGPYETGPPGGLFLEFAKKEFNRYLQIKDFVKTVNTPLAVIELPFSFQFKSQKGRVF